MGKAKTKTPATAGPAYTWDQQTPPPRKERRDDDDPPYHAVRVHNSLTTVSKMGMPMRPVGDIDAEFPVWEVEIEGTVRVVRDPEEAWQ